jgi:hypothetical protein
VEGLTRPAIARRFSEFHDKNVDLCGIRNPLESIGIHPLMQVVVSLWYPPNFPHQVDDECLLLMVLLMAILDTHPTSSTVTGMLVDT